MARTVTSAIVQVAWTGDKESMIELHEKYVSEAASAGTQVMCFQELFYGPVLLPGAGHRVLLLRRSHPRRAHH